METDNHSDIELDDMEAGSGSIHYTHSDTFTTSIVICQSTTSPNWHNLEHEQKMFMKLWLKNTSDWEKKESWKIEAKLKWALNPKDK